MEYEIKVWTSQKASVEYPVFCPDKKSGKEKRAAQRMNRFFESVREYVEKYTESDGFPAGGKYYCRCIVAENDCTVTELTARIRERGRTVYSSKHMWKWENGVVVKDKRTKKHRRAKFAHNGSID